MSRNIVYHHFSTSESLIRLDDELHEDIDFDFFDSFSENHTPHQTERKSNLKTNNVKKIEESANENTGSTVRFSELINGEGEKKSCIVEGSVSTKKEKSLKLRDLMNCIAYGESKVKDHHGGEEENGDDDDDEKINSPSPDFLSLSTDTTSEITNVTTRPSSSGCSSMTKFEPEDYLPDKSEENVAKNLQNNKQKNYNGGISSMKLLLDVIEHFDKQETKSNSSSTSSSSRRSRGRLNMSFTNDRLRMINRENEILVKKLESLRKPNAKPPTVPMNYPRLSSSAINRKRQQRKIEHDNRVSTV